MSENKKRDKQSDPASLTLKGRLELRTFGKTTKSEHLGVYIVTDQGDYLIRPVGSNPFMDNPLLPLAGKTIEATGRLNEYVFFAKSWVVIE
jgi:hypothetical protein